MLTKDILFGMNILTLAGFLVMGLSLTLHRTGNVGVLLSIGLMRWNSSRILRAFCHELVKLAETGASRVGNHRISSARIGRQSGASCAPYSASGCSAG